MSIVKKSYKNKEDEAREDNEKKLGQEFGTAIENNPDNYTQTGKWRNKTPVVNKNKCKGCKICTEYCPEAAIEVRKIGD